jgi:hypothetical protein
LLGYTLNTVLKRLPVLAELLGIAIEDVAYARVRAARQRMYSAA